MPVAVEVLEGSPRFSGTASELRATRRVKLAWNDLDALYAECFPEAVSGVPQLPARLPGSLVLYAESVEFEPMLGSDEAPECDINGVASYDLAVATISYRTIPYQTDQDGQIYTIRMVESADMMTVPRWSLKWKDTGATIIQPDAVATKIIPHKDYLITLHRVPPARKVTLEAALDSIIGKVNDAAFFGAPKDSLLCMGGEFNQTVSSGGSLDWEISLSFGSRVIHDGATDVYWQHIFDVETSKWREVIRQTGGPLYERGDFTQLVRP